MKAQRKRSAQHLLQHRTFREIWVKKEGITNALADLEFGRENEVVEEELHPGTVFYVEIVRTNPDQVLSLPGSAFAGYVKTIFNASDEEQPLIPVRG